jgi:hypothetical protein
LEIPLNLGKNGDMGYSVCFQAMLEMVLSLFPLFEGGSEHDADAERSEDDPAKIYSVSFTNWRELTGIILMVGTYN